MAWRGQGTPDRPQISSNKWLWPMRPWHRSSNIFAGTLPLDTVAAGIRSAVVAMNHGSISAEQADSFIKMLVGTYAGDMVIQCVEDCIEHGFAQSLDQPIEKWFAIAER